MYEDMLTIHETICSCRFSPCALINSEAVHHLNTQSMKEKRANLQAFKEKAKVVLSRYKDLFPNWVREIVNAVSILFSVIIVATVSI
jgi:hypothetical protein